MKFRAVTICCFLFFLQLTSYSVLGGCDVHAFSEKSNTAAYQVTELPISALVETGKEFDAKNFDISPDGRALAVLYSTWGTGATRSPGELRLGMGKGHGKQGPEQVQTQQQSGPGCRGALPP
jgi:hypothetical protein